MTTIRHWHDVLPTMDELTEIKYGHPVRLDFKHALRNKIMRILNEMEEPFTDNERVLICILLAMFHKGIV